MFTLILLGANVDLDSQRKGKSVVIKTTTRQTYFLPVAGLVEPEKLKPGDLVGVNKDGYTEGICPASVTHFALLFQSLPSLSYGGARFLIQAREVPHAIHKYDSSVKTKGL